MIDGKTGNLVSSTVGLNGAFTSGYSNLVVHGTVVTMRLSYVGCAPPGVAAAPCDLLDVRAFGRAC